MIQSFYIFYRYLCDISQILAEEYLFFNIKRVSIYNQNSIYEFFLY